MKLSFDIPIRTVSEANRRGHWRKHYEREREQRSLARIFTGQWLNGSLPDRINITLTRLAPRKLDTDNLARSLKHVQDGVADALGIDDGSERLNWRYSQEKSKEYGVRVELTGDDAR